MEAERAILVLLTTLAVAGVAVAVLAVVLRRVRRSLDEAEARQLVRHLRPDARSGDAPATYRDPASHLELEVEQREAAWPIAVALAVGVPNLLVGAFMVAAAVSGGELAGALVGGPALAVGIGALVAAARFARRRGRVAHVVQATFMELRWGPPEEPRHTCRLDDIVRIEIVRTRGGDAIELSMRDGACHRLALVGDNERLALLRFLAARTGAEIRHRDRSVGPAEG